MPPPTVTRTLGLFILYPLTLTITKTRSSKLQQHNPPAPNRGALYATGAQQGHFYVSNSTTSSSPAPSQNRGWSSSLSTMDWSRESIADSRAGRCLKASLTCISGMYLGITSRLVLARSNRFRSPPWRRWFKCRVSCATSTSSLYFFPRLIWIFGSTDWNFGVVEIDSGWRIILEQDRKN